MFKIEIIKYPPRRVVVRIKRSRVLCGLCEGDEISLSGIKVHREENKHETRQIGGVRRLHLNLAEGWTGKAFGQG